MLPEASCCCWRALADSLQLGTAHAACAQTRGPVLLGMAKGDICVREASFVPEMIWTASGINPLTHRPTI